MTVISSSALQSFGNDQARVLRERMALPEFAAQSVDQSPASKQYARSIAVAGGKGGVGKSLIALNLAIALSQMQHKVLLIDAAHGLGHLDFMAGQTAYWNLSHVLAGAREINEVLLPLYPQVDLISGASDWRRFAEIPQGRQQRLRAEFEQLEQNYDYLILDCGSGYHEYNQAFVHQAEQALLVTTPEPTAMTNTYASLKRLTQHQVQPLVVMNRAGEIQAKQLVSQLKQTTAAFLQNESFSFAVLPNRVEIAEDVVNRYPTLLAAAETRFSKSIQRLALQITSMCEAIAASAEGYFARLSRL